MNGPWLGSKVGNEPPKFFSTARTQPNQSRRPATADNKPTGVGEWKPEAGALLAWPFALELPLPRPKGAGDLS